jgi:hypothetical protein
VNLGVVVYLYQKEENPMKTNTQETTIIIRVLNNEQVPEWIKTHTVWVETKSMVQTATSGKIKPNRMENRIEDRIG